MVSSPIKREHRNSERSGSKDANQGGDSLMLIVKGQVILGSIAVSGLVISHVGHNEDFTKRSLPIEVVPDSRLGIGPDLGNLELRISYSMRDNLTKIQLVIYIPGIRACGPIGSSLATDNAECTTGWQQTDSIDH